MHSIKKIIPPDPLFDHVGQDFPERQWFLLLDEEMVSEEKLERPDFGQRDLMGIVEDSLLKKDVNQLSPTEVESFIKKYYASLVGIDRLSLEPLTILQKTITQSILYQTSHKRAR